MVPMAVKTGILLMKNFHGAKSSCYNKEQLSFNMDHADRCSSALLSERRLNRLIGG